ncbi:alpha/beta hydrolase [Longimicrobium sp.]|jgi:proline iminopeptidase|uniref:alpha/beta fold hydrolase n=1 Tax=Longimicrobium sp. TaxID=2029185 RepID=UPI002F93E8D0
MVKAVPAGAALMLAGCAPAANTGGGRADAPAHAAAPGLRPGVHEVQINGVRLWYRVAGRAPAGVAPVVFLHGGPGQGSTHFDELAGDPMERSLAMVYLDQRGSGRSERPPSGEYSIALLVEDLEELRQHLGVPRIGLIGHSFGALLALEYAKKYPANVSGIVFTSGLWDTPYQCRLRLQRVAELRPEAYARVAADTLARDGTRRNDCELEFQAFRTREEKAAYDTEIMYPDPAIEVRMDSVNAAHGIRNTGELGRAIFQGGLLQYRFTAFDRITMPVLVIAGWHDGAARPAGLRELASRLPNARFVEYERSGHFPYLDEPERFARETAAFFSATVAKR